MKRLLTLVATGLSLALVSALHGAVEADLGEGLGYVRFTESPDEPAAAADLVAKHPQLVIDLRSLQKFAPELPAALHAALAKKTAGKVLHVVLINAETARELASAVSLPPLPHVVTIGAAAPGFSPDIAVKTSADRDSRAHEALEKGAAPASLLNDTREKKRFDEARLVQSHLNGLPSADESAGTGDADTAGDPPSGAATEKKGETLPLLDLVLARAVQLHRATQALRQP